MLTSSARTACAAAAALALLLTGCAGGDDGEDSAPSSSAASESEGASDGGSGADDSGSSELDEAAEQAGIDPEDPPEPVASTSVTANGAKQPTKMTFDLFGLERRGDLLVLTAAVTPDKGAKGKAQTYYGWMNTRWSPQLVDTKNLKVHDVVTTDDGPEVMTDTAPLTTPFGAGQTFYMYAVFAAPPKDVKTVTVKVVDGAPAVTGVTIR
ncbi:hypothetical protein [Janibacter corallicola]|uniref:hypothetical protein n=1 Tax=Janibacter corallicola TaxID=415212 RepID=UPI00082A8DC0|nr:hypothetical protein [Janibacter corallicola]